MGGDTKTLVSLCIFKIRRWTAWKVFLRAFNEWSKPKESDDTLI